MPNFIPEVPNGIQYASGSLRNSSSTTMAFHLLSQLVCSIFTGLGVIKYKLPLPTGANGPFVVEIQGMSMDCTHTSQARLYVFEVPHNHGTEWSGTFRRCILTADVTTTLSNQRCVYTCACANSCDGIEVVHVSNTVSTSDVKMCFVSIQW